MVRALPILIFICILGAVFFWKKESQQTLPIPRQVANEQAPTNVVAEPTPSQVPVHTAEENLPKQDTSKDSVPASAVAANTATASVQQATSLKVKTKVSAEKKEDQTPTASAPAQESAPPEPKTPLFVPVISGISDELQKKIWFQLGIGGAHHSLKNSQDGGVESKFQCIELPAFSVNTGFEVDNFGIDLSFETQPGKVSSSSSTAVVGGSYKWETIKAVGTYRAEKESKWKFNLSVQQDTSPLIYPDPTTMEAYVRSVKLTEVALGAEYLPEFTNGKRFFAKAYIFLPIGSSTLDRAEFKIKPNLHAMVAAGAQLLVSKRTYVGIQGKVQTQDYKFTFRDNPNATEVEGKQSLTSSSIELQLGWNF